MRPPPWISVLVAVATLAPLRGTEPSSRGFDLRPAVALAPVFPDETAVLPAGIVGTWREHTEETTPRELTILADSAVAGLYRLIFTNSNSYFTGRFHQAGDLLLLEMTTRAPDGKVPFLLGTTFWWGVSLERSLLTLRPLSLDLADALAEGRVKLEHRELPTAWVVTADAADVRAVLSRPLPAGHSDSLVLHRQ